VAKALHEAGVKVTTVAGFRSQDLVILEDEFAAVSDNFVKMSDDGTWGEKGLVTDALRKLIESGEEFDEVIAIGPLVMMKFVSLLTKEFGIKTVVSMNPVMVDGTGMCGGCRLTVDGKAMFACVDGPEFDGHKVDFDEALARGVMYRDAERHSYEETCKLFEGVL
jgi:ferredoxin--NADP+ reductase